MIDKLLGERGLMAIPMGSTDGQMAGWFRKRCAPPGDLAGLNVRIGGFAGKILETRGAKVVSVPKENILEAIANGSLGAFEWIAPCDDEKLAGATEGHWMPISTVAHFTISPAGGRARRSCTSSSQTKDFPPCRRYIWPP